MKKLAALLLAMLLSINVIVLTKQVKADIPQFTENFETGYDGWEYCGGSLTYAGTQKSVVYEGSYAFKMKGSINANSSFAGNYRHTFSIPVTLDTQMSFAYCFPSKKVSYVGYNITFNTGKQGFYISVFNGWFENNTAYYLIQYKQETVGAWHPHTVNIYENYQRAYGSVPADLQITAIAMMMTDPYYTGNTQTAFFDEINITQIVPPLTTNFYENFETGSDGWMCYDGNITKAGTQHAMVYEGSSAFKMKGSIDVDGSYAGNYHHVLNIAVTPDTQFSFAYRFPDKKISYVGYYLEFSTGQLGYYISLFNGWFVNISAYYLLQYKQEAISTWHTHTVNVYENYQRAFGSVPTDLRIIGICMMMGDPYYSGISQTAFFDSISIEQFIPPASTSFSEDFETGSDSWMCYDGAITKAVTQKTVVYDGLYAFKMTGSIDSNGSYAGNYRHALNISVTPDTQFSFAYRFPNKKIAYVGYYLTFNTGKMGYYISLFSGSFVNISAYYLLQYKYEAISTWHAHTVNVYENYEAAFGSVPADLRITDISMMMGDPYYSGNVQTAFFDGINIV
jgi:hypothetical protein